MRERRWRRESMSCLCRSAMNRCSSSLRRSCSSISALIRTAWSISLLMPGRPDQLLAAPPSFWFTFKRNCACSGFLLAISIDSSKCLLTAASASLCLLSAASFSLLCCSMALSRSILSRSIRSLSLLSLSSFSCLSLADRSFSSRSLSLCCRSRLSLNALSLS